MIVRLFKYSLYLLLTVIVATIVYLYSTDQQYILRAIRITYLTGHKSAFLEDYKYFDNRPVATARTQPWPKAKDYNQFTENPKLEALHAQYKSTAFLIIQQDSILYERYYNGFDEHSISNTFSVTKSVVSACLGKAIELGYIKSLDEKVIDYFPELKGAYAKELTLGDLVRMRSGMKWEESYSSPFSITTKAYFHENLSQTILDLPIERMPNESFRYQSGDTQLLAMILSKVLPMSLSEFFSTYFWKPLGAETTAQWQYNPADGIEKSYCCLATSPKDMARMAQLFLKNGNWQGKQILNTDYIAKALTPAGTDYMGYGLGWWLGEFNGKATYTMNGHLGQFIITIPQDKLIIVRYGHAGDGKKMENPHSSYRQYITLAYELIRTRM